MDFRGNDLHVYRTVRGLMFSLALAIPMTLAAVGSAGAVTKAAVEIGFVGQPPPGFQNVLLNIVAVRVNPKATAGPTDPNWQKIGVPAGIGQGGSSGPPELQLDLNNSQDIVQLFNTGHIRPNSYHIAQLILDPNNPGSLVPNCPQAGGVLEGCINYPFQLANAGSPINVTSPKGSALVAPSVGKLTPLVLQLQMAVTHIPAVTGGTYTVSVTLSTISGQFFGTVTGNVPSGPGSQEKATRKLAVTAETIGTNTEIASAPVVASPSGTGGGTYTLLLPAATNFGTNYDLAVAGGKDSYAAARLLALVPGNSITQDFSKLSTDESIGSISGRITDDCTGSPLTNATIQLLIPPLNNPKLMDGSGDCTVPGNAAQCVSVASATTDVDGDFPLPGTLLIPAPFDSVPILPAGKSYAMMVSAPGYDTLVTPVNAAAGGSNQNCNGGISPCKIALTTGTISGTIPVVPPIPGETIAVQVFAEDTQTNNIVSAMPSPLLIRSTSGGNPPYKINVPTNGTFDLFARTQDNYQKVSDPFEGHTIAVLSGVTGPATSSTGQCAANAVTNANFTSDQAITCTGHGSIIGSLGNANLGASVLLGKQPLEGNLVQITNAPVQNQLGSSSGNPQSSYSFCVPGGDTYVVQAQQLPTPATPIPPTPTSSAAETTTPTPTAPVVAPTPAAVESPVAVFVPPAPVTGGPTTTGTPTSVPTPTSTPTPTIKCPTNCSISVGTCPGICGNVIPSPPLTLPTPSPQ